ncbi:MAG: hypothetical protein ABH872_00160 [Candidatus Omnitrophota bacterium]
MMLKIHYFTLPALLSAFTLFFNLQAHAAEDIYPYKMGKTKKFVCSNDHYEPSGIIQIENNWFLIVDDKKPKDKPSEKGYGFLLFNAKNGIFLRNQEILGGYDIIIKEMAIDGFDNMEAITKTTDGIYYAVTSNSIHAVDPRRNNPGRKALIRFKVVENDNKKCPFKLAPLGNSIWDFRNWVISSCPQMLDMMQGYIEPGSFDIEGLSISQNSKELLIGLRKPLTADGHAIIVRAAIVSPWDSEKLELSYNGFFTIDMSGRGVSSIEYSNIYNGYLVCARTPQEHTEKNPEIFILKNAGNPNQTITSLNKQFGTHKNAEGITTAEIDGKTYLLIAYDRIKDIQKGAVELIELAE